MVTSTRKVVVIGAGVSGLVTAKVLRADGFDVVVYEREPHIGGVWAPSRTYPGLRANITRDLYRYSDHAYPQSADDFPTAGQVRAYLHSYVARFDLEDSLRRRTEVVSVERDGTGEGFVVSTRRTESSATEQTVHADFVVVCDGVFSKPHVPTIEGAEQFDGPLLHSSQFTDPEMVDDQRVVVVGAGKSALDCAAVAAERGRACSLVFRSARWMIPQHIAGIRYDRLLQNRLNEMMFEYHDTSGIERLLHGPLKPLVRLFWWVQGHVTRLATGAPPEMVPDHPIPADLERLGIGAPFYRSVRQGRATPRQGEIAAFTGPSSLRLDDGESLEADVVVFATGWEQHLDVLAEELRTSVLRDGRFHLFRHILPPDVPRLGFVGYASSFVNTLTSELAAHWLAEAFRGDLDLPDRSEQERAIASVHSWADAHFSSGAKGDIFIGPHVGHYADELLRDLGLDPYRASNCIAEYFGRLLPHRYAGIGEERRALRQNSA